MYGYPKLIATRHDVDVLMGYLGSEWATEENKAKGVAFFRGLIASARAYVFDRMLAEGEAAAGPLPEYIVLVQEDGTRRQERLVDDPAGRIYRLGYTVAEVEAMIATIEGGA
jgi:hypothetical protein